VVGLIGNTHKPKPLTAAYGLSFTGAFDGRVQEVPGTFSTANGCLANTTPATARVRRDTANADFQMKFWYCDSRRT